MYQPDKVRHVKVLQLLPLAFLANVDGFLLFVPYMLFILVLSEVLAMARRRSRRVSGNTQGLGSEVDRSDANDVALATVNV